MFEDSDRPHGHKLNVPGVITLNRVEKRHKWTPKEFEKRIRKALERVIKIEENK